MPPALMEAIPESWLDILDESIKHRGPDGCGRFRQRVMRADGTTVDVALVHRRLSIIDHGGGAQPMVIGGAPSPGLEYSATLSQGEREEPLLSREGLPYGPARTHVCPKCGPGVAAVAFNGCIYNHRELRRELEAAGHEFFTDHSDTEVLLHGWRAWGKELFGKLEGMYAVLCWDSDTGRLLLARDAFGEKPLYFFLAGGEHGPTLLSSCPLGLAIVDQGSEGAALDDQRLVEWIRLGYDAEATPFHLIGQVGHGKTYGGSAERTALGLSRDGPHAVRPGRMARLRRSLPTVGGIGTLVARVDEVLSLAVAERLEADVPLGCLLSGGVDSSLIAQYANMHAEQQLTTICVRMPDERYDESRYAQIAAETVGSRHLVVDADPNPAEDLLLLIQTLGLPFGDSSLLPTYWACRAAAAEVKVLLSGDGGDELFLGYERYSSCKWLALGSLGVSRPMARLAACPLARKDPKSRADKLSRFLRAIAAGPDQAYREILAIFSGPDAGWLFDLPRRRPPLIDAWVDDPLDARDYDLHNHLPGDMLRKVDTASMLANIELRAPFLDREVARVAMGLPAHRLMPRGRRKGLLRAVARRYFPAKIVDRPKMGFAIPVGEWFRSDYGGMRQLLHDHLESADPFPGLAEAGVELDMNFVRRMMREHDAAGEKSLNPWHGRDHSQRLYMLVVLSIWCRWLRGL